MYRYVVLTLLSISLTSCSSFGQLKPESAAAISTGADYAQAALAALAGGLVAYCAGVKDEDARAFCDQAPAAAMSFMTTLGTLLDAVDAFVNPSLDNMATEAPKSRPLPIPLRTRVHDAQASFATLSAGIMAYCSGAGSQKEYCEKATEALGELQRRLSQLAEKVQTLDDSAPLVLFSTDRSLVCH